MERKAERRTYNKSCQEQNQHLLAANRDCKTLERELKLTDLECQSLALSLTESA